MAYDPDLDLLFFGTGNASTSFYAPSAARATVCIRPVSWRCNAEHGRTRLALPDDPRRQL